jgi:hypothetical protein
MRHTSILLAFSAACSQSALIGEQDPTTGDDTSAVDGAETSNNGGASTTDSAASSTTGEAAASAETGSDGSTPTPTAGPCAGTPEIGLPPELIAHRLAKLMYDSEPSEELLEAAQNGDLSSYGEVECQALDMIEEPEHQAGLLAFLNAWLELGAWQYEPHPDLAEGLWSEMQQEATTFVESFATSGDATLTHLLTEPETRVGATLAAHYGIEPAPEDDSTPVTALGRQGVLSLGLVTSSLRRIGQRGAWVTDKFLCFASGSIALQEALQVTEGQSYRETYDDTVQPSACSGCHALFDGPGHALERFDELGRVQETDAGDSVRTHGQLLTGLTGEASFQNFEDTSDFIQQLSHNPMLGSCLARRAAGFATGLGVEEVDGALSVRDLEKVVNRFEASERDLRHLLVGLTQTDLFWQE